MDFVETCRQLISIESTPTHGTLEVAQWLAELCRSKGLKVEIQEEFLGDTQQANVIARLSDERPQSEFLFQAHLDTVDPGPFQLWNHTGFNPFDATIRDNKIYGLGSAEVKLDFLCKLEAIASFAGRKNWKLPPVLVGTFGEELGMQGALKLIRKNKISAKMALIGEPSDLNVIVAAKGITTVEIKIPFSKEEIEYRREHNLRESTSTQSKLFIGKAAHSATPQLGENAINKMLEHLLMLPDQVSVMEIDGGTNFNTVASHALLEIDLAAPVDSPVAPKISNIFRAVKALETEFQKYQDPDFTPAYPTLNIGMVRTFEDHIMISGNCRLPPVINQEIYEAWMGRLQRVCEENGSVFRINDYKKPFRTSENSMLVKACLDELRAMKLPAQVLTQASTNEASIFSRVGIECVCFGPGKKEDNVHTPQEHVSLDDLQRAVEFYKRMIERFCA